MREPLSRAARRLIAYLTGLLAVTAVAWPLGWADPWSMLCIAAGSVLGWWLTRPGTLSDDRLQQRTAEVMIVHTDDDPESIPWVVNTPAATLAETAYALAWRDAGGSLKL